MQWLPHCRLHSYSKGEYAMSIIGAVIMWVFALVVFAIITRWPMGKTYEQRAAFWKKYDGT